MKRFAVLFLLLIACQTPLEEPAPLKTLGDSCSKSQECELPMNYAVQSNCPFQSACLDGVCRVVCPIWNQGSASYVVSCQMDSDCDCAERSEKTQKCVCSSGSCVSVEA